jgi:hypothetical protein
MDRVIIMSEEEYDDLINVKKEPDILLQETVDNYKYKLDSANSKIRDLEKELRMFVIGGAKIKDKVESELDSAIHSSVSNGVGNNIVDLAETTGCKKTNIRFAARELGYRVSTDGTITSKE